MTIPNEKRRNAYRIYNPMTLKELQNKTDSVETFNPHAKVNAILIIIILFYKYMGQPLHNVCSFRLQYLLLILELEILLKVFLTKSNGQKTWNILQTLSFRVFTCVCPTVISSIFGKSFHFPFPYFVHFLIKSL